MRSTKDTGTGFAAEVTEHWRGSKEPGNIAAVRNVPNHTGSSERSATNVGDGSSTSLSKTPSTNTGALVFTGVVGLLTPGPVLSILWRPSRHPPTTPLL